MYTNPRRICSVQLLDDEPFEVLKPIVEELLADKDKNKQRAAAEFLAGVISGKLHINSTPWRSIDALHPQDRSIGQWMHRSSFGSGSRPT